MAGAGPASAPADPPKDLTGPDGLGDPSDWDPPPREIPYAGPRGGGGAAAAKQTAASQPPRHAAAQPVRFLHWRSQRTSFHSHLCGKSYIVALTCCLRASWLRQAMILRHFDCSQLMFAWTALSNSRVKRILAMTDCVADQTLCGA